MRYKIKTLNKIHQSGLDKFPVDIYSIDKDDDYDALICRSADLHKFDFPATLKAIARAGSGVNNIPIDKCTDLGMVVFNTLGANANAVKELVLASMLVASRNLFSGYSWLQSLPPKDTQSAQLEDIVEKQKKVFAGTELKEKTLGIIGLGSIGHQVANLGISFDMKVLGYDPYLSLENALQLSRQVTIAKSLDDIVAKSDFISIHVAYTDATHNLINQKFLAKCRPNMTLLNFARQHIVDEVAIIAHLNKNPLSQYISDFPSEQTLHHPRIINFPHLGASTVESEENCSRLAVQALRNFLEKGIVKGSVNYPNCQLEATENTKFRLIVGNENVANVVGKITNLLGQNSINIEDMINTHKHNLAYNIIDIDKTIDKHILSKIASLSEVKFIRLLTL